MSKFRWNELDNILEDESLPDLSSSGNAFEEAWGDEFTDPAMLGEIPVEEEIDPRTMHSRVGMDAVSEFETDWFEGLDDPITGPSSNNVPASIITPLLPTPPFVQSLGPLHNP